MNMGLVLNNKTAGVLLGLILLSGNSVHAQSAAEYLRDGNDSLTHGYYDKAISEFTKAIDMNPNLAKAYDNRGVAYAQEGSYDRAIADFTIAIANNSKDPEALNNRGHAYAIQGNLTQAIHDYTKAIESNAFYVKAYNNREIAYYKLEKYDKAWADVHTAEAIGGAVDPRFIEDLKKASGKDN
jgi:tetratricopeptide (TPR) repeat protein